MSHPISLTTQYNTAKFSGPEGDVRGSTDLFLKSTIASAKNVHHKDLNQYLGIVGQTTTVTDSIEDAATPLLPDPDLNPRSSTNELI